MEARGQSRAGGVLWIGLALVVVLGAGAAGYTIGRDSGQNLDAARASGTRAGEVAGAERGSRRGYRAGLRKGREQAFEAAYKSSRRRTIAAGAGKVAPAPINRSCGNLVESGAGSYNVQSVDVICDIALQVARQWEMQCAGNPSGDCTVRAGFYCDYTQTGYELGTITCTSDSRQVTFETGA